MRSEYLNEEKGKKKRWVVMGMSVGKRWGVLDGSKFFFFFFWRKLTGVIIYIYIHKGNKVESTHENRAFFFRRSK